MPRHSLRFVSALFAPVVAVAVLSGSDCRANNWPQFRGENGSGASDESGFTRELTPDKIQWKVEVPGIGHSAPVIWGEKLFLTSAGDLGKVRYVLCLDARSGQTLWTRSLDFDTCPKHPKSSWASSTPAVDGERVYAVFADVKHLVLSAFDFDGKPAWRRDMGGFESQHAQGASPIVFEDLVILVDDQDGPSSVIACDKRTGKTVWRVKRNSGSQATSYATPFIFRPKDGPPQLICSSSHSGVSALDPRSGETIWTTGKLPQRTVASPVTSAGLIFQTCGSSGQWRLMVAVDPSGKGDVAKSNVRYERKQILPYVHTPLVMGNYLYLWSDHGIVCCVDPLTGRDVWTKRIGGDYSGSPVGASSMIYNVNEAGDVIVLAAGPQFKQFGRLSLGEACHSTPAIANGRIYFRTFHHLACVAARP